jgi:SAM-dependent methyltransferase
VVEHAISEEAFLADINRRLPPGVDWKQGAITYLRELVVDGGAGAERYHLVKPFVGGPDFSTFWVDAFHFLDLIQKLDLPHRARVIDVGCGPGWTIHWLGKLGHTVIGCDISQELLDVAEQRMQSDPHPPFPGEPFDYQLLCHDIESTPLGLDAPADAALFESTLHHFFNPVATLRNIAADLTADGVIGVIEAAAPPEDSEWDRSNLDLMERYHTIERPYTREQLLDLLDLAGFRYVELLHPVNGLYRQQVDVVRPLREELVRADNVNIVVASRTEEGLARIVSSPQLTSEVRSGVELRDGFYGEEERPDGSRFRWAEPRASIAVHGRAGLTLDVSTAVRRRLQQRVVAVAGDQVVGQAEMTSRRPRAQLVIPPGVGPIVELQSDTAFSPAWDGDGDARVLSFMVDVPAR